MAAVTVDEDTSRLLQYSIATQESRQILEVREQTILRARHLPDGRIAVLLVERNPLGEGFTGVLGLASDGVLTRLHSGFPQATDFVVARDGTYVLGSAPSAADYGRFTENRPRQFGIATLNASTGWLMRTPISLDDIQSMALDGEGNAWIAGIPVTESGPGDGIYRFDPRSGDLDQPLTRQASTLPLRHHLRSVCADASGKQFFTLDGSVLKKHSPGVLYTVDVKAKTLSAGRELPPGADQPCPLPNGLAYLFGVRGCCHHPKLVVVTTDGEQVTWEPN